MLNKDNEEIVIFNQKKEMKCGESNTIKVISIISMVIMMVLIILIIHYLCKKRKNRYNSIKLEKDFTHFSSFDLKQSIYKIF